MRCNPLLSAVLLLGCLSQFLGCGGSNGSPVGNGGGGVPPPPPPPPTGTFPGLAFTGEVLAGNSPLVKAKVQLYAAGTTGDGSAPTALLADALFTDAHGAFTAAAGSYTCPVGNSTLFVVATGGSFAAEAATTAREFITVPGTCEQITGTPAFVLNEVTTAATAYAFRPLLRAGAQLGATATNTSGLALAAGTLASLVNLTNGTAPGAGFPANGTAPAAKLNTLANLLNGCAREVVQNASSCTTLFARTSVNGVAPANTLEAAVNLANQPSTDLSGYFAIFSPNTPFSPALPAAPPDWTLAVPFTGGGMNAPASVAVDSVGNVWVTNYFAVASLFTNTGATVASSGFTGYGLNESYGGAVDGNDVAWIANQENTDYSVNGGFGSITLLNNAGPALPGDSQYASGGLSFPVAVAIDGTETAWVVDYGNGHLTLLNNAGMPQSGDSGYASDQFAFPVAVAVDSKRNGWLANQSASTVTKVAADGSAVTSYTVGNGPSGVAVDAADNVWTANYYGDSLGLVSAAGNVLSGAGFPGGGLSHPVGIAADGSGTVWVANYRGVGISEFTGAAAAIPGMALSPSVGWGSDLKLLETYGLAIDAAGDVWVSSFGDNRLVEFVGLASPVKTPLLGSTRVP